MGDDSPPPDPPRPRFIELADEGPGRYAAYIDLVGLEQTLGRAILIGLIRCGVWLDRLASLEDLAVAAIAVRATNPERAQRDNETVVFLGCGCVHELSEALRSLEEAGIAGLLGDDPRRLLVHLRALFDRWQGPDSFVKVRDKAGFHVDADRVRRGFNILRRLAPPGMQHPDLALRAGRLFVGERDATGRLHHRHVLASIALTAGVFVPTSPDRREGDELRAAFDRSTQQLGEFLGAFWRDFGEAKSLVIDVVMGCIDGAEQGRRPTPIGGLPRGPNAAQQLEAVCDILSEVPGLDEAAPVAARVRQVVDELQRWREAARAKW